MCAAAASQLSGSKRALAERSPSPQEKRQKKVEQIIQDCMQEVRRTKQQHAQFKREWNIGEKILFRGGNAIVVEAEKKIPLLEEVTSYVAKIFRAARRIDEEGREFLLDFHDQEGIKEICILNKFHQLGIPHVPQVIDASWDPINRECIIVLYDLGSDLAQMMDIHRNPLPIETLTKVGLTVLNCLIHLTEKIDANLKHADIKLRNILCEDEIVTLIDWNSALSDRNYPLEKITTLSSRAPEVILRLKDYGVEVDIWAFAITLFEAATYERFSPIDEEDELGQLHAIYDRVGVFHRHMVQRSPIKDVFFKKNTSSLRMAPVNYVRQPPFRASLKNMQERLIKLLPPNDPNVEKINSYYCNLISFLLSLFKVNPLERPKNHRKVLKLFHKSGLA